MLDMLNRLAMLLFSRKKQGTEEAVTEGINLVAAAAALDRMSVFRNSEKPGGLCFSQIYRWTGEAKSAAVPLPSLTGVFYAQASPRLESVFRKGECLKGPARLMPEAEILKRFGCVEIFAVPIFNEGDFWGYILFERLRDESFTTLESEALRSAGFMLASALIRNENSRASEYKGRLLETVNRVASILLQSSSDALGDNIQESMRMLAESAGADRVYIWKNHRRDGKLYCSQIYEWSGGAESQKNYGPALETSYRDLAPGLAEQLSGGRSVNGIVRHMRESARAVLEPQNILSILIVPIFLKNRFWGFIGFDDCHKERLFSKTDENTLRSASEMIAGVLARLNLEMEAYKIFYDPLTGIYNRRFFDEKIQRLIQSLSRSESLLTVMMIDVDHFKLYNDIYGHLKGDACLKSVAESLKSVLTRADDFTARYGGEEFVAVLPNTAEDGARFMARKMIENVRSSGILHEKNLPMNCVTISVGVTCGRVGRRVSGNDFIMRADEMLYISKEGGRNRYTFGNL